MSEIEQLQMAVGSTCELARMIRDEMLKNGFTREEAFEFAMRFTKDLLLRDRGEKQDDV